MLKMMTLLIAKIMPAVTLIFILMIIWMIGHPTDYFPR